MARLIKFEAYCADLIWAFVHLSPVAYPKLNYALELGLRFSQFFKSSQYLIKVSQEIIRKRREAQRDAAYVKVWYIHCLHYINQRIGFYITALYSSVIYESELNKQFSLSNNT